MKTIRLNDATNDWRHIVAQMQQVGEPIGLELDGMLCGLLLPPHNLARLAARFAPPLDAEQSEGTASPDVSGTYLDLLRADPALVPVVDGQPLEFMTMMNSSYVDPQQIYQFRHPKTRQIYLYRAGELQQAIGRTFDRAEFIPQHPRDYVDGKS